MTVCNIIYVGKTQNNKLNYWFLWDKFPLLWTEGNRIEMIKYGFIDQRPTKLIYNRLSHVKGGLSIA